MKKKKNLCHITSRKFCIVHFNGVNWKYFTVNWKRLSVLTAWSLLKLKCCTQLDNINNIDILSRILESEYHRHNSQCQRFYHVSFCQGNKINLQLLSVYCISFQSLSFNWPFKVKWIIPVSIFVSFRTCQNPWNISLNDIIISAHIDINIDDRAL